MSEPKDYLQAQKIQQALIGLMAEMDYQSIRIHQIAEKAQVSRNTFYRNFKSKDQVIMAVYDEAMSTMLEHIEQQVESRELNNKTKEDLIEDIVFMIFSAIYENMEQTKLLFSSDIDELIYSRFSLFFTRLCGQLIRIQNLHVKNDRQIQFLLSHLTGSGFHFFKAWVLDKNPPAPEEIAHLYARLLQPGLELIQELAK